MSNTGFMILILLTVFLFGIFLISRLGIIFKSHTIDMIMKSITVLYLILLFSSIIVLYNLPNKGFVKNITELRMNQASLQNNWDDFFSNKKLQQVEKYGISKNGEWSFDYKGDTLSFSNHLYSCIYVEKRADSNDKIKVMSFIRPHIVSGIDFTTAIKPPNIEIHNGALRVFLTKEYEAEKIMFNKDFTIVQFQNRKNLRVGDGYSGMSGPDVLFLSIPQNVKLDERGVNIKYVNKVEELSVKTKL